MLSKQQEYLSCMLCDESFQEGVTRYKAYSQLCCGCGTNHNNKVSRQNKRAKKEGHFGKIYLINWIYTIHTNGYSCACCKRHGSVVRLTMDHIVPLSRGGKNLPENIQPLCVGCHVEKDRYNAVDLRDKSFYA